MDTATQTNLLDCYGKLFQYYRELGEKAMEQIEETAFQSEPSPESNSVSVIVQHISGNMLSRFTDFLSSDGEKPWRNREAEFEANSPDKASVLSNWDKGWDCFFEALNALQEADLEKIVYIRNQGHTVLEALSRQLAHYSYHIGQIVYLCRMLAGDKWVSLSIPKGGSQTFNAEKFSQEKARKLFVEKQ